VADALTVLALVLALTHFSFPLLYYLYLRSRWLNRDWGVVRVHGYAPKVSIIIPTYNEVNLMESKLNNIVSQSYPKELMEVIVVDSASNDNTPNIVREWIESTGISWLLYSVLIICNI
jgi:cellulose synthase/poly-beta-1,6-N-acetylglucosamine synthase-like glycosyltransferase